MGLAYIANQRIRAGHQNSAANPEQENQREDAAKTWRTRQSEECDGDQAEPEDKSNLLAFVIEQRSYGEGREDESQRLRKGDGAILAGRQVKTIRQVGQDGAQHGGNHPVDKDSDNGGEN